MTATANPAAPPPLNRARGQVSIGAKRRAERTVVSRLRQQGSAKAMLPRPDGPDLTAVLVNTAGGITGGDQFDIQAEAGAHTALTLTTQTAERAYRARPGSAAGQVATRLEGATSAILHWLPQETILFDGCALNRRLDVELAKDAVFLAVEPVILGRAAMGETIRDASFIDQWRIRRNGHLIYADALRLMGDIAEHTASPATLNGHRAFASIVLADPDAERALTPLRRILPETAGASLIRDGVLTARMTAPDSMALRRALIPVLEMLRGHSLPTVWKM